MPDCYEVYDIGFSHLAALSQYMRFVGDQINLKNFLQLISRECCYIASPNKFASHFLQNIYEKNVTSIRKA